MIVLAILIFLISVLASMLGQGGGVLYTPTQVWYGIDFHTAATTSLFLIMVTSVSASLVYRKAGQVDWPMALALESSTAVGGFLGGYGSGWVSGSTLSVVFAFVVATAAVFMIGNFRRNVKCGDDPGGGSRLLRWKRTRGNHTYCVNMAIGLPGSFLAGLASGLVGIGGGILKVPLMVILLGVPMEIAVGSSAFMVGLTAAGGFAGHIIHGHWDWRTSLILAVGVFLGAQLGGHLSIRSDPKKLKKITGWFLLAVSASMLFRAIF